MKGSFLEINSYTWEKDTHGLFDYETKSVQKSTFNINEPCCIYRYNSDCYIPDSDIIEGSVPLLKIDQKLSDYRGTVLNTDPDDRMWLVIKGLKSQNRSGYKLREGDLLKLGRIKLRVQKICVKAGDQIIETMPNLFQSFEANGREKEIQSEDSKDQPPCRICLVETETPDDPLICPCKCAGTMKYIHSNCLREWIKSKLGSRVSERGMTVYLKDVSCELCNSPLPSTLQHKGQNINLVSLNYPNKSFIMFEEYRPERMQKNGLHMVYLDEGQNGSLGRGHDCDIKISDISVSRKHCRVKLLGNEFFLEDSKSKFGTLVGLTNSVWIRNQTEITVQVSRTVFHLAYKEPFSWKKLCCCRKRARVVNENFADIEEEVESGNPATNGISKRVTMNQPREISGMESSNLEE
jgi:hypothetical protein